MPLARGLVMSDIQMDDRGLIIACPSCAQRNRVPYGKDARCVKCKTPLPAPNQPIEAPTVAAFDALIKGSVQPVVVDFWAPWCGPCRMVAPELAKVAASHAGWLTVVKVNTDVLEELGSRYSIRSIPTMAVFEAGTEVGRTTGARPAADIEQFVRGVVGKAPA
jgi:thioredoxin 2